MNQPYWLKKNPSLLSYEEIFFETLKKNALVKEFSLAAKEKCFRLHTHNMDTDRYSGIWAKRILSFGQFWAGGAVA